MPDIDWHDQRADIYHSRPEKRNAMDVGLMRDLIEVVECVDDAEEVWAVALLGEGRVFSAGMDLSMMRARIEPDSAIDQEVFPELLETIEETRQPVVAGIKRAAPAGAFELTLPCDFRVLGRSATYGLLEVSLGTFPHGDGTQRLSRLVGLSRAKEIALTGKPVDPEEAERMGLVHEVCADEAVDDRTKAFADHLCENAPLRLENGKRALNGAFDMPLDQGLAFERALGRELDDTDDYREGSRRASRDENPNFAASDHSRRS